MVQVDKAENFILIIMIITTRKENAKLEYYIQILQSEI
jgi:hypothetical protein